ncbi:MAG: helix-turn-helix domain-containing protein [Clostridium sp.]|nr:helix-turn-helix domain-containing protein [Clostridium sp.]
MPRPIKNKSNFEVTKSITYNGKSTNAHMAALSAVTDHFEIGLTISGDRHVYSTDGEWDMHSGYVGTSPLNLPHQSYSVSDAVYAGILVKYSFAIADSIKSDLTPASFNKFYNERFHILNAADSIYIRQLFEQMLTEYKIQTPYTDLKLKSLLELIIIYVMEHQINAVHTSKCTDFNTHVNDAMRYIESNYADAITLDRVCKRFGFSPAHFSRLFKQVTGDTFSAYLSKVRLENAVTMLITTDKSIESIAFECGFNSISYFSFAFKKNFHKSPLKYRAESREIK